MSRSLLIIGAGRLQVPAYTTAKRLGLRVVGVDRNPKAPGMAFADAVHAVDTNDIAGVCEVARMERVHGVVTLCTDFPVRAVAAASRALGLCAISPESATAATHKGLMRQAFEAGGAPIPQYRRVQSLRAAVEAAQAIGLPVIVKPPASSGSRGIFKVTRPEQMEAAFRHAKFVAGEDEVLVEEFVEGPEVSVETLSFRGEHHVVTITDKRTSGDPHWVETGHVEPSRISSADQNAICRATLAGLQALNVDNAAGHVEIKIGKDGPRIMEIGARLGGDFITTELVLRSTGVDMVEAIIRVALGERPDSTPKHSRGAAIRYLFASAGRVVDVSGVEEAREMPGVVRLEIDVKPGDTNPECLSSVDRPGFVIAEGMDAQDAEERAVASASRITIRTTP
jgi:biotin carboxylase